MYWAYVTPILVGWYFTCLRQIIDVRPLFVWQAKPLSRLQCQRIIIIIIINIIIIVFIILNIPTVLPSASRLQKSGWPMWIPWKLSVTYLIFFNYYFYYSYYYEELESLYCSHNIVRVIISRKLRWAGHVGKRPLGRLRRRWEDNIRMDLKEVGINTRNWIDST